ncbi:hypothetical protein [Stutzerimonas xanthomarina]|uniref:hypothetical protein n=1 Tax=Stutzerimonas xanthomarina TaxID=271420 RepID=UPI003AA979C2
MDIPDDLFTNPENWYEYDCDSCGIDYDLEPVPLPGTEIKCSCGHRFAAWSGAFVVYLDEPKSEWGGNIALNADQERMLIDQYTKSPA